ncbi:MAG: polymer-forming cytoskeletal protein [Spirochaetaceae bacterium]|jgi:cytoskeletal protein CcmA (bactofilin family)|nr:polymer-forming cytoskeletal protein [Spirochaetaceae bacterium]GMO27536.1 MAG: polymer-forming cytoskeletal protein [Termitinemataceae bacterium]
MPEKVNRRDVSINTIIGPNTDVNGDICAGGFTRVDGNVRGELDASGRVVIGERARMKSNITGTAITIGGVVKGNVLASERLVVLSTGLILGDVITRRIQADEGCIIHGNIIVCRDDAQWKSAISEYEDALGVRQALLGSGVKGSGT